MAEDHGDMKKLFKAMQILIFYQCQYHLTHVTSDSYDEKTVKSVLAQLFGKTEVSQKVQKYSPSDENPLEVSPSKRKSAKQ
ncbi:unnamed protein product [Rhizophagus irregularis]|nr:unnamed protein product [Rhizophagus irregularis]